MNHWTLFWKLLCRGVPAILVRALAFWYCNQTFTVRWGSTLSTPFNVTNGVRQGGILSPYLYNVYIDDLSHILSKTQVGCYINGVCANHLAYADDTVILAPSAQGLQDLLHVCEVYAKKHNNLLYSMLKRLSVCE